MTEVEWGAGNDPQSMLMHLKESASDRKLRLFACACVRQGWELLSDVRSRTAVEAAERHADRRADDTELDRCCEDAVDAITEPRDAYLKSGEQERERAVFEAACAAHWTAVEDAWEAADQLLQWNFSANEDALRSALLRCIFGNPFRPVTLDPAWHTSTVTALARGIYEDRAFDRLPILADALQDAGCDHPDILAHCRSDGPHARGCWVVDLVLGQS